MGKESVLANAVINVVANVSGMRSAMRETQTQLWGLLTLSNHLGGRMSQAIASPMATYFGMHAIYRAQNRGNVAYREAMDQWNADKPSRPERPDPKFKGLGMTYWQHLLDTYAKEKIQYKKDHAEWLKNRPDRSAIMSQAIEKAGLLPGKLAVLASAFVMLGNTMVQASHYASQFHEELNKMVHTFGKSSDNLTAGITVEGGSGINRTQMMSAVSTIGIELMGAGIKEAVASQMAMAMAKRAIDMTSFYNLKDDEASLDKVVSGLAGMGRPLKELGVILNETRVETYALTHGLWDGKHEFSEAAKVQARYGLIMQETQRAEGDRMRTMYDLENQYRGISANWSNLMTTLAVTAPIKLATAAINLFLVKTEELVRALNIFGELSTWFVDDAAEAASKSEISKQNRFAADRVYADEIIADAKKASGERKNARHTSLEGFAKGLQEGVFNDSGKMLVDLTRVLVGLTKEQVEALKKVAPSLKAYTADNAPQGSW